MKTKLFTLFLALAASVSISAADVLFSETFSTRRGSTNIDKVQLDIPAWPYANQWYTGYTGTEGAVEGNQYDNDYTAVESYGVSVRGKKLNGGDKNTVGLYFSSSKEEAKDYVKFTGALPEIPAGGAFLHFQICSTEADGGDLSKMIVKVNDQAVNVPATSLGKQYVTSVVTISLPAGQMNGLSFAFDNVPSQKFINRFWIDDDLAPSVVVSGTYKIGDLYYYLDVDNSTATVVHDDSYANLTTAIIPATVTTFTVTSIGERAFQSCSSLTSVTIPNSVTSIGENAFEWCSNLTSVESPALLFNDAFSIFRLSELEMPSQIMHLTINAGTLTEEGFDRIRASYRNMKSVDIANAENTELSDEAFKGCYNLQTLRLPAGLKEIKYMAVAECVKLQAIDIPATVESIGDRAFEDCRSMATVTFAGNAIQSIGCWAFYNCHALQNIVIPEGVTEIGDGAFYGCTYLADVSVPASARIIGDNAFALCSKMAQLTVNAVEPPVISSKTFDEVSREMPVYVPNASVAAYKSDPLWGQMNIIGCVTGVDALQAGEQHSSKILRNGEVLILRDDKTYTVQGQEVR